MIDAFTSPVGDREPGLVSGVQQDFWDAVSKDRPGLNEIGRGLSRILFVFLSSAEYSLVEPNVVLLKV